MILKPEFEYEYRSIPTGFDLDKSNIHKWGLFRNHEPLDLISSGLEVIPNKCNPIIYITHVIHYGMLIRTPLGSFINHSPKPNCKVKFIESMELYYLELSSIKLDEGEELLLNYHDMPKNIYQYV